MSEVYLCAPFPLSSCEVHMLLINGYRYEGSNYHLFIREVCYAFDMFSICMDFVSDVINGK